jgi:hypothetical protein
MLVTNSLHGNIIFLIDGIHKGFLNQKLGPHPDYLSNIINIK